MAIRALILALILVPSCASAQVACSTRDTVITTLGEKYGETRRSGGLVGEIAVYEMWANEETGTWTILRMTPDGLACAMAAGTHWRSFEEEVKHEDAEEIH